MRTQLAMDHSATEKVLVQCKEPACALHAAVCLHVPLPARAGHARAEATACLHVLT